MLFMGGIMVLSGLLSTMNVWVDTVDDIRISLNDVYMIGLMTGWMFFFMGLLYKQPTQFAVGLLLVGICLVGIRGQFFITTKQFMLGMIPHHSMAIHMSKQQLTRSSQIQPFLKSIIETQESEIQFMKRYLQT